MDETEQRRSNLSASESLDSSPKPYEPRYASPKSGFRYWFWLRPSLGTFYSWEVANPSTSSSSSSNSVPHGTACANKRTVWPRRKRQRPEGRRCQLRHSPEIKRMALQHTEPPVAKPIPTISLSSTYPNARDRLVEKRGYRALKNFDPMQFEP